MSATVQALKTRCYKCGRVSAKGFGRYRVQMGRVTHLRAHGACLTCRRKRFLGAKARAKAADEAVVQQFIHEMVQQDFSLGHA